MSRITRASFEVYREVYPVNPEFPAQVGHMTRLLLGKEGRSIVRETDNRVVRTQINLATVYGDNGGSPALRYLHGRVAGEGDKWLNKKLNRARTKLEDGTPMSEPLSNAHGRIATAHGSSPDVLQWGLILDEVDIVTDATRSGVRNFIVLRSIAAETKATNLMLMDMTAKTTDMMTSPSFHESLTNLIDYNMIGCVPIASVMSPDIQKAEIVASHIREFLPLHVIIDSDLVFQNRG